MVIYTHNIAADILDFFDDALEQMGVSVPSPEDDERDRDNSAALYGSTYSAIFEEVEDYLASVFGDIKGVDVRSGNFE